MATAAQSPSVAVAQAQSTRTLRSRTQGWIYLILIIVGILSLIPFVWMFLTSVKTYSDVIALKFWPWPPIGTSQPAWGNFAEAMARIGTDRDTGLPLFVRHLLNTTFITVAVVVGVTLTSVLAAYAFAQLRFPGKGLIFIIVLITLMIPDEVTLVPRAVMMNKNYLGWYNTYLALTMPFLVSAFGIFLLRQFFMQIPRDLWDAARIDGAGHLRYLTTVMVPLARPAILTVALFNFIWTWNEYRWAQLVTSSESMRTVSVGLQGFLQAEGGTETQLAMAVAVMVVLPILVLYFFTQRYFTEGISTTGLKG